MIKKLILIAGLMMSLAVKSAVAATPDELWIDNGDRHIYGILDIPDTGKARYPLVIVAHGFNGTSDFSKNYMEEFSKNGIACYGLDFPGGSTRSRSDNNTMNMSILGQKSDVKAVVDYFRQRPEIDPDSIYVLGESQGGITAALAAAEMPEKVCGMILVYPAFCIPDNWNSRYKTPEQIPDTTRLWNVAIGRDFFLELRDMDAYRTMKQYGGPVLIIHGTKDNIVPVMYSIRAAREYPNAFLYIIKDAGHGFKPDEFSQSVNEIIRFVKDEAARTKPTASGVSR